MSIQAITQKMSCCSSLIPPLSSVPPTRWFLLPSCFCSHTTCCPVLSHLPQPPAYVSCFPFWLPFFFGRAAVRSPAEDGSVSHSPCLEYLVSSLTSERLYFTLQHFPNFLCRLILLSSESSKHVLDDLIVYFSDHIVTLCPNVSLLGWQGHEVLAYSRWSIDVSWMNRDYKGLCKYFIVKILYGAGAYKNNDLGVGRSKHIFSCNYCATNRQDIPNI